jgi:hypothetical protein
LRFVDDDMKANIKLDDDNFAAEVAHSMDPYAFEPSEVGAENYADYKKRQLGSMWTDLAKKTPKAETQEDVEQRKVEQLVDNQVEISGE